MIIVVRLWNGWFKCCLFFCVGWFLVFIGICFVIKVMGCFVVGWYWFECSSSGRRVFGVLCD